MADGSWVQAKGLVLCTIEIGSQKILGAVFVASFEDYALPGVRLSLLSGSLTL